MLYVKVCICVLLWLYIVSSLLVFVYVYCISGAVGRFFGYVGLCISYIVERWIFLLGLYLVLGSVLGNVEVERGWELLEEDSEEVWVFFVCCVCVVSIRWNFCLVLFVMLVIFLVRLLVVLCWYVSVCLKWFVILVSIWYGGSGVGSMFLVFGICLDYFSIYYGFCVLLVVR